jgi:hypothetical protein
VSEGKEDHAVISNGDMAKQPGAAGWMQMEIF